MKRFIVWSIWLIILVPSALSAQEAPVVVHTDLVTVRATVTDATLQVALVASDE